MFDIRALVAGRHLKINDGLYVERHDPEPFFLEEWLRSWQPAVTPSGKRATTRFLNAANRLEPARLAMSDQELRQDLKRVSRELRHTGFTDELLAQSFASIREASRRVLGKRHHDVQLLAGRALLKGNIAEMATGEGKTLAGTLGVCTAAACGAAVHVVTVNDYLAERDAEHNIPLFEFFGFSVGIVLQDMPIPERRDNYCRNIVYVSNKELTFDYLKDRISFGGVLGAHHKLKALHSGRQSANNILQGLHIAIVDEVDSVLIDEARTPLIISETLPDDLGEDVYDQAIAVSALLEKDVHFKVNADKQVWLTEQGLERVEAETAQLEGVWRSLLWRKELVQKALSALHVFLKDENYIIAENKIQIVDEFTGRVMPDRTWERGLHQMIEAKEGCEITGQRKTLSQITYQRFFGRYVLLSGMTGTAKEIEPELKRVYNLSVTRIPTHKPSQRKRLPDHVLNDREAHFSRVVERSIELAQTGRSVLVGARSVESSERVSRLFEERGIDHVTLNARQDQQEAEAVAQAGQPGRITVATNMAGRGTDIKLAPEVAEKGGLHVILTEFHESARIDRQLFGRSARQGDPGSVEAIVFLGDELFQRYARYATALLTPLLIRPFRGRDVIFRTLVAYAQAKAERHNRRIRLDTIKKDRKWLRALGFVGGERK